MSCGPRLFQSGKVFYGQSKFDILVGNHGCCVLRAKEEEDLSSVLSALSSKAPIPTILRPVAGIKFENELILCIICKIS